jgi:hypothetical protein
MHCPEKNIEMPFNTLIFLVERSVESVAKSQGDEVVPQVYKIAEPFYLRLNTLNHDGNSQLLDQFRQRAIPLGKNEDGNEITDIYSGVYDRGYRPTRLRPKQ